MPAICKFRCCSVAKTESPYEVIKLTTDYDPTLPEDQSFTKFTPSGSMEFNLQNPALDGFFVPGKKYYVEIRECV